MRELLKTEHLSVSFFTKSGEVEAVRDVSLTVEEGEVLAIVGESGCGKSALCKSIMKLLPKTAKIKSGKILADGIDITDYTQRNMSRLRGALFSMIFQDPMTSLNPTMTIGKQIGEAVRIHNKKMPKKKGGVLQTHPPYSCVYLHFLRQSLSSLNPAAGLPPGAFWPL